MRQVFPNVFAIRGWLGWTHLLVDNGTVTLLDGGFVNERRRIQRAVLKLAGRPQALRSILLTHGHLDHTLNAAALQRWSGAEVIAPADDRLHVAGLYPYAGAARVCGALEWLGRKLLRYRPPQVTRWVQPGDELPVWGGLRVVGLPGHTAGHVGYYSARHRVLFVGDAFAVSWRIALPPRFLNTDPDQVPVTFRSLAAWDVEQFIPAHYLWLPSDTVARVRRACYKRPA
ncbi:MAG: MBL fold metallo-hydrolase [Verrucomicrobiae bacterium]|nr:MBL fold metallo-hydrolase [Verrucomicrobiae bacterium]